VYIPASKQQLLQLHEAGQFHADIGFVVDDRLVSAYELDADDDEMAEFAAMQEAAEYAQSSAPAVVIVVAADIADGLSGAGTAPGEVRLASPVTLSEVASMHVGTASAGATAAATQVDASELGWWAVQELPALLTSLE
jgi:hypothetical protein